MLACIWQEGAPTLVTQDNIMYLHISATSHQQCSSKNTHCQNMQSNMTTFEASQHSRAHPSRRQIIGQTKNIPSPIAQHHNSERRSAHISPKMVLRIRLARFGKKHSPFYNIVVAHARYAFNPQYLNLSSPQNLRDPRPHTPAIPLMMPIASPETARNKTGDRIIANVHQ